jgi:hypothetical protein
MSSGLEKSTCYSSNQVPEQLPEVEYQDDGLKSQVPTGFSDFGPDSSISTQMEEPTSSPSEPVLESGLTEEQTKFVRKWLQDWHATLEYERRRAETRRWMTEEWLPEHPPTKHTNYEGPDDGNQVDVVEARKLLNRLKEEHQAKGLRY